MFRKWLISGILILSVVSCQKPMINNFFSETENPIITANQNFSRTGFQPFIIEDSLRLISSEDLLGLPFSYFLQYAGELIFTTHNGHLYFVSLSDFDNQRKTSIADGIGAAPSIAGKILYIAVNKGEEGLIAYDMATAKHKWAVQGMYSQSSPVITDQFVIHATIDGQILAYNILDGTVAWEIEFDDAILNSLAKAENIFIVAGQNGKISSYNTENGYLNWSHNLNDAVYASPVIDDKNAYLATYSGSVIKIDKNSGEIDQRFKTNVELYKTPVVDDNNLYIAISDGKLISLEKNTFKENWQFQLDGPISFTPLLAAREILVGTESRKFYRINKSNGEIIQMLRLEGRPRIQPIYHNNKIYLSYGPDYLEVYSTNGRKDE